MLFYDLRINTKLAKKPIKVTKSRRTPQSFKITQKSSFYKVYLQLKTQESSCQKWLAWMKATISWVYVSKDESSSHWIGLSAQVASDRFNVSLNPTMQVLLFKANVFWKFHLHVAISQKKVSLQRWIIICLDYDFHWFSRVNFTGFPETFEKHLKVSSVTTKKVSFIFTFFGSAHCDE